MPVQVVEVKVLPATGAVVVQVDAAVGPTVLVAQVVVVKALPPLAVAAVQKATSVGPVVTVGQVVAGVVMVAGTGTQVPGSTGVQTPDVHDWTCDVLWRVCAVVFMSGVETSVATPVPTSIEPTVPAIVMPATGSQNQTLPSGPVVSGPVLNDPSPGAPVAG